MLKMRLQRIGRKNDPAYRVVVVDSRQGPKSGKFVDLIGTYNPKLGNVAIEGEKAKNWISKGVQVSPTVHNMLINKKVIEGKKINVLPKKTPPKKEGEESAGEIPVENTESAEVPSDEAQQIVGDVSSAASSEETSTDEGQKEEGSADMEKNVIETSPEETKAD